MLKGNLRWGEKLVLEFILPLCPRLHCVDARLLCGKRAETLCPGSCCALLLGHSPLRRQLAGRIQAMKGAQLGFPSSLFSLATVKSPGVTGNLHNL